MNIGTPLSDSALRVMLLGSGELGKEVIIELQRLGVETIAVDRYANAPGHQVAHRAHVINMANPAELRRLIHLEKPHLVVPEIEAIATHELEALEAEGICKVVPTARATRLTMNRAGIRRLAAEQLGLPTSSYRFATSVDELRSAVEHQIGLPCFVKPVMSSSGKGQTRVTDMNQLQAAWDYAARSARIDQGEVIVEGAIDFDYEITLLTVRSHLNDHLVTSFCEPIGHLQIQGDYVESWQPQPMSALALQRAQDIAGKVTSALGGSGIFGVELFVRGDDVWFSEVSPRPHDTGMVTMSSQYQSEFELHARALLGLPVDTSLRQPAASAVIYGESAGHAPIYTGLAQALQIPGSTIRLFGKPEAVTKRRMGVALARGENIHQARERAKMVAASVGVTASSATENTFAE